MPLFEIPCPSEHRRLIEADSPPGPAVCPACGEPCNVTWLNHVIGIANGDAKAGETVEVVLFDE